MISEFEEINKKYNDDTFPVFPFIDQEKVILLKRGLYKKHRANYRGVTAKYNKEENSYEFPLYGMYKVEEDLVIVPESLDLAGSKGALLDVALKSGFKQVSKPPIFETIYFPEDSLEAKLALANKVSYNPENSEDALLGMNSTI